MIHGLYIAASGMHVQQVATDTTAHNLANVNTTGFRRQHTTVASFPRALESRMGVSAHEAMASGPAPVWLMPAQATDTTAGMLRQTGVPTDLALQGDGLFAIHSPQGMEAYTRNGAFILNDDRQLATTDGWLVQGERGPITIDHPQWEIDRTGRVVVDGTVVDRLRLVRLPDASAATRLGDSRWLATDVVPAPATRIAQGYLENSNVNSVAEMVALITATRQFEANQRCVHAIDATLERAVNDIGRLA